MQSSTSSFFLLPVIVSAVLGAVSDTVGAADHRATQTGFGTIEMRILGSGDDVRFFVDGKSVASRERTASSDAARAQVEVPAGEHKAVAYVRNPARGNAGEWIQLSTRGRLLVTAGSVTRLDADVSRAGSGKPEDTVRYFHVTSGAASSTAAAGAAPAGASVESTAGVATAGAVAAVPTITIRGTEVLFDDESAPTPASAAASDPLDVGTPGLPNDAPAVADLPPPPDEITPPGRLEVSFLVQSVPPGAEASLDGKLVGKTPLHVQLDPRLDHLLTVGHVGCQSVVQLLATDAWRAGRSPQALVQLDCE